MGDLISRQAAIDAAKRVLGDREITRTVQTALHILPSAQPERKTARWIPRGCGCFECDECGERVTLNAYTVEKASDRFRFCYHCGARMEEGGE